VSPRSDPTSRGTRSDAPTARAWHAGSGVLSGFALLAAVNAVAIAVAVPLPGAGLPARVSHHVFDAAETLGLGSLLALLVAFLLRFSRPPRWGEGVALFAACTALVDVVAGDYLLALANGFQVESTKTLFAAEVCLLGGLMAAGPLVAEACLRRPWLRFAPLGLAVGALVLDQSVWRDDHADLHGLVALGAILLGGAALAPQGESLAKAMAKSRRGRAGIGVLGTLALLGLAVPPPNATRLELFRQPCAVAPWVLATALWRAPSLRSTQTAMMPGDIPPPWSKDRSGAPPVSPSVPPLLPADAVVVLLTVDALRADVVDDPRNHARFPTLARLEHEGVHFTHAVANGTQTAVSLAAMFSGLYFSEEPWTAYGTGRNRSAYPAGDPAPRFPELLSEHGVVTVDWASLVFLRGDYGVARGFREESVLGMSSRGAPGEALVSALLNRLDRAHGGPLFAYTHLLEPHAPYKIARRPGPGSDFERYVSMIAVTDALVERVFEFLESHFGERWALFVSADHGEAFGDHETTEHGKTLYEELLRVPLIAYGPLFPPHKIDVPVSLVDLGPTLLDLFGVPTPATSNGQSLVPFLRGETAPLTRPLLAEGRLRRSLTGPDGTKVIEDLRRKFVEVYDLRADPGETRNLWDIDPVRSDRALSSLRAFFDVHGWRENGYEPPYKL
jgi:hypothetical protein